MADGSDILTVFAGGVRLSVRAKPGLSRRRLPRVVEIGEGKRALEITVAAIAEDGKANAAILAQLAEILGLKRANLRSKSGETGRLKTIEIAGNPAEIQAKIRAVLQP